MLRLVSATIKRSSASFSLPLAFSVLVQSGVSGVWHLAFNPTGDFLCVCTLSHVLVYSLSALLSASTAPLIALEMDAPLVAAVWSAHASKLELGMLMQDASFRVYQVRPAKQSMQCLHAWNERPVTAIEATAHGWALGFADGSLLLLHADSFEQDAIAVPPHVPPSDILDSALEGEQFGVYALRALSPDALLVGMAQYESGRTPDVDPAKLHIAAYHLVNKEWIDYGDVLRDEDRCAEDQEDKLYEARYRMHTAAIPQLSAEHRETCQIARVTSFFASSCSLDLTFIFLLFLLLVV